MNEIEQLCFVAVEMSLWFCLLSSFLCIMRTLNLSSNICIHFALQLSVTLQNVHSALHYLEPDNIY